MDNSKDVVGCVLALHPGQCNYGAALQGYATIKITQGMGYNCEIIKYNKTDMLWFVISNLSGLIRSGGYAHWKYLRKKKKDKKKYPEFCRMSHIRRNAVDKFKTAYLDCISKEYTGYKALQNGSRKYRVIFVGSDQVWKPLSLYRRFYNLYFVADQIPKFSYASSFGTSDIFPWQRKRFAGFLNRLDMIGVREMRGKEIVRELTGKEAQVVADPTFLLSHKEWSDALERHEKKRGVQRYGEPYSINNPYILMYVLGDREDIRKEIKKLHDDSGIKIVNLPHVDNYHAMDDALADINLYDVDPFDFIRLIRDADYVVTDSFHGSVFSILMHKKFMTFYRDPQSEKRNTNSRIDSLFAAFDLGDRLFKQNLWTEIQKNIDYDSVEQKLSTLRKKSLAFLERGLMLGC